MPLQVNSFIVIDLPADAKEVVVANPAIANVLMQTARRVVILGKASGQTNIAFYDAARRQIEAFDVTVLKDPPVSLGPPGGPKKVVTIFRGELGWTFLSCTETSNLSEGAACYPTPAKTRRGPWILYPREAPSTYPSGEISDTAV